MPAAEEPSKTNEAHQTQSLETAPAPPRSSPARSRTRSDFDNPPQTTLPTIFRSHNQNPVSDSRNSTTDSRAPNSTDDQKPSAFLQCPSTQVDDRDRPRSSLPQVCL